MVTQPLALMVGGRVPVQIGAVAEVELVELLGMGGFGSAWKARDLAAGALYVLKVVQGLEPGSTTVHRLRLEAGLVVHSEHAVTAHGLREWDTHTCLLLFDYVSGASLEQLLEEGRLTNEQKRRIFDELLVAVADIHRENIIHRDIKPANIMVADGGSVKLIDFGVSKFEDSHLTRTGEVLGTLEYMAPELLADSASAADARTDIYALGQVLYELTGGRRYWQVAGWEELRDFVNYLFQTPPPTEAIDLRGFRCPFYPNGEAVLARMVKLDPAQRFATVAEVQEALGRPPTPAPVLDGLHSRYPQLVVQTGSNAGARTLISIDDGDTLALGRYDLAGADSSISRRHVEFHRAGDRWFVRDLGSKNGTMLGGTLLDRHGARVEIRHDDRIRVGDVYLGVVFVPGA